MLEFFEWLAEFFINVWETIQGFIQELVKFYEIIMQAVGTYTQALLSLPTWLRIYGGMTLTVCAIYMVIGREGGK